VSIVEPADIFTWKNFSICVKKANDWKLKDPNCPPGYQDCGSDVCIKQGSSCPITSIYKSRHTDEAVRFGNQFFRIEATQDEMPIISLDINPFGSPCVDIGRLPKSGTFYPLIKDLPEGCGKYGEDNVKHAQREWD
jgi:hypothetical protein